MSRFNVAGVSDVTIGRFPYHRLEVDFGLSRQEGMRETVHHGSAAEPIEFAAMGLLWKGSSQESGGQNLYELLRIIAARRPEPPFTIDDLASLHRIWKRWHLNAMKAACVHMVGDVVVYEDNGYGGQRISTKLTVCPETGYRYGTKWLVEPLPDDVLAEVMRLIDLAKGGA